MRSAALALCAFLSLGSPAGPVRADETSGPPPLSLSAELDRPSGVQQLALVFRSAEKVELITNGNFLEEPGSRVKLGRFEAPMSPYFRNLRDIVEQETARAEKKAALSPGKVPPMAHAGPIHRLKIRAGENEIEWDTERHQELKNLLRAAAGRPEWVPVDGVEAVLGKKGAFIVKPLGRNRAAEQKFTRAQLGCEAKPTDRAWCEIPGWGSAYFK